MKQINLNNSQDSDINLTKSNVPQDDIHSTTNSDSHLFGIQHADPSPYVPSLGVEEEEHDYGGSLTRQLAETAVGVREMSKQLGEQGFLILGHRRNLIRIAGRARVRSNIQSILIVTKARDNRLIKLTRELALYLMLKKGSGDRGLVV